MSREVKTAKQLAVGFPEPRALGVTLGLPFALFFGLSFGYPWLTTKVMNSKYEVPDVRDTYGWGDGLMLLVGVLLCMWLMRDNEFQMERLRHVGGIVSRMRTLGEAIFDSATTEQLDVTVSVADVGGAVILSTAQAVDELLAMVLTGQLMLIWQFVSRTCDHTEAHAIVDILSSMRGRYSGKVPLVFKAALNEDEPNASLVMLGLVRKRIEEWTPGSGFSHARDVSALFADKRGGTGNIFGGEPEVDADGGGGEAVYLLRDRSRLLTALANVTEDIRTAIIVEDFRPWCWILTAVRFLGVVYLVVLPWILWPSQGDVIHWTYPVIFLFVGGLLIYNIVLSDVFQYPTTTHVARIYKPMQRMETAFNEAFAAKYPDAEGDDGVDDRGRAKGRFFIIRRFLRTRVSSNGKEP